MVKNKFNKNWLYDHMNDPYVKLAQKDGYRARSAYKLSEIDAQYHLIKPGMTVIDLGSAPGSWSQYLRNRLAQLRKHLTPETICKPDGRIIAIDLLPMESVSDVTFIQGDFLDEECLRAIKLALPKEANGKVDLVLSDMAPNLSGVGVADAARITNLAELSLEFTKEHLKPDGALLIKCFHGSGYSQIVKAFKMIFKTVASCKPKASRAKSSETFLLGFDLR